ncbi:MAG: FAD-binding protein [Deltaproteobacteria bacterium]|jgi:glycolate oxidase|nr:FAD-binding protein [Deltaproteobacteria bacterium]
MDERPVNGGYGGHERQGGFGPHNLKALADIVGREYCRSHPVDLESYSYDSSPFIYSPAAVVIPGTIEEMAQVVSLCRRHGWPLTCRGAGTSLSGGAVARLGGVMLSTTRLNRLVEIDPLEETVLVECGLVNLELQKALAPLGYMYPPDPASQKASTLGGNVAENAGGIKGVKYGITKHHVLGLELILDDGSLVRTGALKRGLEFNEPDLTGIFLASEGTLALVARALLRITPLPAAFRTMSVVFDSLRDAGQAVASIIGEGIIPTALEIMDKRLIAALEDYLRLGFPAGAEAMLLIEIDGLGPELDAQLARLKEVCFKAGAVSLAEAESEADREKLWLARRSGNGAMGRLKPGSLVQDVTVPISSLPAMLAEVQGIADRHGIVIVQMAHAGDGNLHPHILFDPADPLEYARCLKASADIFAAALRHGGTITGEHGIGLEKVDFMAVEFTEAELGLMAAVKSGMDPTGILNPGKVLPRKWQPRRGKGHNG